MSNVYGHVRFFALYSRWWLVFGSPNDLYYVVHGFLFLNRHAFVRVINGWTAKKDEQKENAGSGRPGTAELESLRKNRKSRPQTSDPRRSMPITRDLRAKETDREGRDRDALLIQLARTLNRNFRAESAGTRKS